MRYAVLRCLLVAAVCAGCASQEAEKTPTPQPSTALTPRLAATRPPTRAAATAASTLAPITATITPSPQTVWQGESSIPPRTPFPTRVEPFHVTLASIGRPAFLLVAGYDQLVLTNPVNGRAIWLTDDPALCDPENTAFQQSGDWSPDGRYLAITCGDPTASEEPVSVLLDADAGTIRRMKYRMESWSPDGKHLLVSYNKPDDNADKTTFELGVTNVAEESLTPLISFDDDLNVRTSWSPDSKRIAVLGSSHDKHSPGALFIINADGSGARRLEQTEAVEHFYGLNRPLLWSRDGRWLLVSRTLSVGDAYREEVLKVDAENGAVEVLAPTDVRSRSPIRWSPDGAFFFVLEHPAEATNPFQWSLYRADGTLVRHISSDARHDIDIAWLPDSRSYILVAVRPEYGLVVIRADIDGAEREIAGYPNAGPGNPPLALSPDGTAIAVAAPGDYIHLLGTEGGTLAEFRGRIGGWRP